MESGNIMSNSMVGMNKDQEIREAEETKQQHFRFLDLPPELRNRVYNYALVEKKGTVIPITPDLEPPALLSTSKQVREESLQIWYRQNRNQNLQLRRHATQEVRRSSRSAVRQERA